MKIGILQTGKSHESLLCKFGDYPDLFKKFLSSEHFVKNSRVNSIHSGISSVLL